METKLNSRFLLEFSLRICIASLMCWSCTASGQEPKMTSQQVLDYVFSTYGGNNLNKITSLEVYDKYKVFSLDQGPDPKVNTVSKLSSKLSVDFSTGKKERKELASR